MPSSNRMKSVTTFVSLNTTWTLSLVYDPVICMAEGTVLAEGTIEEVKNNERLRPISVLD